MPAQLFEATPAAYVDAFTIQGQLLKYVQFAVSSPNSALYQIAQRGEAGDVRFVEYDLTALPGSLAFSNIYGIKFKSADPANPTVVLCRAFFVDDPLPIGFTPSGAVFGVTGPVTF